MTLARRAVESFSQHRRPQVTSLVDKTSRFLARFNERDVEGVLATFAPDGVFIDPNGVTHRGQAALRAAFTPLCDGMRGLDILTFEGEKLMAKNAFCKAREILVE